MIIVVIVYSHKIMLINVTLLIDLFLVTYRKMTLVILYLKVFPYQEEQ